MQQLLLTERDLVGFVARARRPVAGADLGDAVAGRQGRHEGSYHRHRDLEYYHTFLADAHGPERPRRHPRRPPPSIAPGRVGGVLFFCCVGSTTVG